MHSNSAFEPRVPTIVIAFNVRVFNGNNLNSEQEKLNALMRLSIAQS